MSEERLQFQAEVSRLLDIVAKSLYSEKEVFLRELISNASDACDKLRYAALTEPGLMADGAEGGGFKITLSIDKQARTLTVADNGIGMNRDDLLENLGTIARSGTAAFLDTLGREAKDDVALIGQFGVGFYSAFMVADHVAVLTRKAGDGQGWRWMSDGKGEFTIAESGGVARGTRVILHLAEGQDEFLEPDRLRQVVKTHSDHIAIPVVLAQPAKDGAAVEEETLNRASALWTRPRNEISDDDYKEFYHHVAHAFDEPWMRLHYRAEGTIEYTALLFVPTTAPFDLFHPDREHRVKLYVRRVFVSDRAEGLLPPYLRFLRGIVDSEDLPLNVSREMLQHNPVVAKIRHGLTRRVLSEIGKRAEHEPEAYNEFWSQFGALLKEGAYEDFENRDMLLSLLRFRSSLDDGTGWISLADYLGRMKEGQEAIYTIIGDDLESVKASPQLEGFRARGIEVLLLCDPVDEFWIPAIGKYQDKPFKSVTRGGADLAKIKTEEASAEGEDTARDAPVADADALIAALKTALGDEVKDVRSSERLTDSPVCLVADEGDMDMHLERLLMKHKQLDSTAKRILEINPGHPLIVRLAAVAGGDGADDGRIADMAFLLLDQARIAEGEPVPDAAAFTRRMSAALARSLED